ncbi:MAG TPA: tRNA lysidine(34) synthetase TilS [Bryobacteraceae bacterium]|nr:tRNA lysidine(34) synthetase TilS [Bryobacteraceae bacterium]
MLERVFRTICRHGMFASAQKVAVAVSGGADSVCLLYVLRELAPRWALRLSVAHLNHRLRGPESEQDVVFVRNLAGEFGFPFLLREADLAGTESNLEQAGRDARIAFFRDLMADGTADRVALGHTRSDQAETVLFRFLRGAATAGLAGIRPVTTTGFVRPLLEIDRSEVEEFLRSRGIPWREDLTNRSLQFARNRIRHELLPALARDWNPAICHTLAHTADWALAEEEYWEAEIARLAKAHFQQGPGSLLVAAAPLRSLPMAAARRLVRHAMERIKGDLRAIDFAHISAVVQLAGSSEGHGRLQVPGLDIMRSFDWLRFAPPATTSGLETRNYRFPAPVPGTVPVPSSGSVIVLELIENPTSTELSDCIYNEEMGCVDWRRVSGPLELRNWRPGDRYQPEGSTGEEKIKTLFQQSRVPLWERRHWPVLIDGTSIVWTRGFGPAASYAAGPGTGALLKIHEMRIVPRPGGVYINEKSGGEVS